MFARRDTTQGDTSMPPRKRKATDEGGAVKRARTAAVPTTSTRITRGMVVDGPRKAVFNTAELLEHILLYVPVKTVFAIQRLCRQFRDIVATSVKLQKAMFLHPPAAQDAERWAVAHSFKPAIWAVFPAYELLKISPGTKPPTNAIKYSGDTALYTAARCNPLIKPEMSVYRDVRVESRMAGGGERGELDLKGRLNHYSSWRRMYAADAPCKIASFSVTVEIKTKPRTAFRYGKQVTTDSPHGFTFGEIVDACLQDDTSEVYYYTSGMEEQRHEGKVVDLVKHLEAETGRKAALKAVLQLRDIIMPTEKEKHVFDEL